MAETEKFFNLISQDCCGTSKARLCSSCSDITSFICHCRGYQWYGSIALAIIFFFCQMENFDKDLAWSRSLRIILVIIANVYLVLFFKKISFSNTHFAPKLRVQFDFYKVRIYWFVQNQWLTSNFVYYGEFWLVLATQVHESGSGPEHDLFNI